MEYARAGHRCAINRVRALADLPGLETRSGPYGLAVRSGAASNDLNAVVGTRGFAPDRATLEALHSWWDGAPASWLVDEPDVALTHALVDAGWIPERTGRWCGRHISHGPVSREASSPRAFAIKSVDGDDDLEEWLDVAFECGWIKDQPDRAVRRDLLRRATSDLRQAIWVARRDNRAVGMARGWCSGSTVELVDVAVRDSERRHGVGTALVTDVLVWGAAKGARKVVAAPSPDGWRLFDTLGFENVPVLPDVSFYWAG